MTEKTGWLERIADHYFSSSCRTGAPDNPPFKTRHIVLMILLLAFFLRVPFLLYPEIIHSDGTEYIRHAKEVVTGNWTGRIMGPAYPALIAAANLITNNYEMAGIWISVILGSLLILPVFYLGRAIFSEQVGVLSSLLAAVQPFLYAYSGSVLTESTYYFLVTVSVLLGWKAFAEENFWKILLFSILFSLFLSLAYLTRPEAIALVFLFSVWVLLIHPPQSRRPLIKRAGIFLMTIFCFIAFSSPYLIQMKKETGKWGISKKASVTIETSSSQGGEVPVRLGREGLKIRLKSFIYNPLPFFKKAGSGLFKSLYRFNQAYTPILFFLTILGWIGIFRNRPSHCIQGSFYILSCHILFFCFVFPFFWIEKRYVSQMVAISLPWAAFGFLQMMDWAGRWSVTRRLNKKVFIVLFLVVLGGFLIRGNVMHFDDHRLIQKEAGLWMKAHLPSESKVMSRMPQEAFYAEMAWIAIPAEDYKKVLMAARSEEVQFLVADKNIDDRSPGFWEKIKTQDLVLVKEFDDGRKKVAIFKIIYPS